MRLNLTVCAAFLSLGGSLTAATISLDPLSGSGDGQPGQPAGWGFTIVNDSPVNWISFTGSLLIGETNPAVGSYMDFIGAQGGPVGFALPPQMTWIETFSDPNQTGVGEFLIDPNAPSGAQDSGSIRVTWEQFSSDPASCNCIPAAFSADLPFQVAVDNSAPEPGTVWLTVIGGGLWLIGRLRWACRDTFASGPEMGVLRTKGSGSPASSMEWYAPVIHFGARDAKKGAQEKRDHAERNESQPKGMG